MPEKGVVEEIAVTDLATALKRPACPRLLERAGQPGSDSDKKKRAREATTNLNLDGSLTHSVCLWLKCI